jgi:adenylylsulfate kinase-like enzyme
VTEPMPEPVTEPMPRPGAEPVTRPAGTIVWFTGLPASGKSTLARRVQAHFTRTGRGSVLLDGDELRDILGVHSYAPEDRDRFYRALGALAALLAHQGIIVLVAATAPRRPTVGSSRSGSRRRCRSARPAIPRGSTRRRGAEMHPRCPAWAWRTSHRCRPR